ncbi:hypothetical protein E2C01_077772 [Portunus trituberculatus]|uniref:Uncharacterized protein n=1 Tax=Portunus trituberculatus TaxID=210409 RepID=A0A5B7ICA6_PORTR|nr:hypothetical protein [Portunus trituberculatus]
MRRTTRPELPRARLSFPNATQVAPASRDHHYGLFHQSSITSVGVVVIASGSVPCLMRLLSLAASATLPHETLSHSHATSDSHGS